MVKFIEQSHQYISIADEQVWTSVTQLIHKYEPYKNWDEIAERYAKKHKIPVEEVKRKWKNENEISVKRGTLFHKEREDDLLSCETIENCGSQLKIYRPIITEDGYKISPNQKLDDGIYPELLVLLNSARICGQADYVIIHDGVIHIKDYKTNKEIKKNGYVNWEGIEEKMLSPISSIPNSNYWHYALQLNIYAYIIKRNNPNLKIGTLELLHIKFDEQEEVSEIEKYQLPNLQSEVKKLIDHFKFVKGE